MQLAIRADVFHRALKSTAFAASRDFDPRRPAFSASWSSSTRRQLFTCLSFRHASLTTFTFSRR
jgi:hypothetical protein